MAWVVLPAAGLRWKPLVAAKATSVVPPTACQTLQLGPCDGVLGGVSGWGRADGQDEEILHDVSYLLSGAYQVADQTVECVRDGTDERLGEQRLRERKRQWGGSA